MFDVLFGWRKASKCKKLIRRVQSRLRLLRNKRDSIVRNLREDVSRLVEMGYLEIATERAEQLPKDERVMDMYDLLNNFCELVVTNMSYIRRHRECPNDVNEAVSSLIFASARCGELPELRLIRELFRERYGERFALVAVDLLPGNPVNPKIREQLSMKAISNDSKFRIVDKVARDQLGIQPEILSIEHASDLHKKIEEMAEQQGVVCLEIVPISPVIVADSKQEDIGMTEVEKNAAVFDSVVAGSGRKSEKSRSQMQLLTKSANPKVDRLAIVPPPYELNATIQCSEGKEGGGMLDKSSGQMEGTLTSSAAESSAQFTDLKVVYLNDVEEVQSSPMPDAEGLDQRLFKFKQSVVPKVEKTEGITSEKDNRSPRASRRSKIPSGKRFRRRSVSREPEIIDNVEYAVDYNAPPGNPRKHLKQSQTEIKGGEVGSKPKNYQGRTCKVASARQESHCNCCVCRKARDQEVFDACPSHTEGFRGKLHVLPDDSSDTEASSSRSVVEEDSLLPSYVRAMTMPPKRQTVRPDSEQGKIPRSNSCPFGQQPNHVHPKLPDYDELAAKFSALKKEFLGTGPMLRTAQHI